MINSRVNVPKPKNEPILNFAPGSAERAALKSTLNGMMSERIEIPLFIGGKEITTGDLADCICPHEHGHVLARYHQASAAHLEQAANAAEAAHDDWASMAWEARLSIFLKAADLLATKYRHVVNAATMLGQSKTVFQAEIDSACELIDFYRFNPYYAAQLMTEQPLYSPTGTWNYVDHRPLEGFVLAVTPFNFTSIAGNLPTAPAMMGNTVIWKPASTGVFPAYFLMKLLQEAGLPPGVINFLPGRGSQIGRPALEHPNLAGVHFTGSTKVFQGMWKTIGSNIERYRSYPRIVGETGGKDFIVAHPSADENALATAIVRGAFEYQGQKCSAASRAYLPKSLFDKIKDRLVEDVRNIAMGSPLDFCNFMCAVIDSHSFSDISGYIKYAKTSSDAEILVGGECDDKT
ncbi:MAG: aldehyde dehydrogenase family protein, partial [Pseudomonadota bacterium]